MSIQKFFKIGKVKIYPICRSLTGDGTLKTLKIIKKNFKNFKIKNFKSRQKVFDWKIPSQWDIKDAYIIDKYKKKIVNFKNNNLHIVGYSMPINKKIDLEQLLQKLYTISNKQDAIPYITSYYKKSWGFCVTERFKRKLRKDYNIKDKFHVVIDSKFNQRGKLNYGEYYIKGKSKKEILISTYICHPSMANDNLSGIIVSMALINFFNSRKNNKSIRFLFLPETIGSIAYIYKNLNILKRNVIGGYILSCIGDDKKHSCMFTKYGDKISDDCLRQTYKQKKINYKNYSFLHRGSDERQFCSPGIDLPLASIFRTKYGEFPEYHNSMDNFNLVTLRGLNGGFAVAKQSILNLDNRIIPIAKHICEPQLGKRGLYKLLSEKNVIDNQDCWKILDFLQYADGTNDINKIAKYIKLDTSIVKKLYSFLVGEKLLQ